MRRVHRRDREKVQGDVRQYEKLTGWELIRWQHLVFPRLEANLHFSQTRVQLPRVQEEEKGAGDGDQSDQLDGPGNENMKM